MNDDGGDEEEHVLGAASVIRVLQAGQVSVPWFGKQAGFSGLAGAGSQYQVLLCPAALCGGGRMSQGLESLL